MCCGGPSCRGTTKTATYEPETQGHIHRHVTSPSCFPPPPLDVHDILGSLSVIWMASKTQTRDAFVAQIFWNHSFPSSSSWHLHNWEQACDVNIHLSERLPILQCVCGVMFQIDTFLRIDTFSNWKSHYVDHLQWNLYSKSLVNNGPRLLEWRYDTRPILSR